ncbi:hypothetical protein [Saccharopolyspora mangrovi]|uniref:Uncharacterized protein n=1 Tax=Saccharopolyspora mangrovi TaxID=3082379 RepID=A0ABU6AD91_9PSEU|nr:hypothetical protein [Saccharopolyspora sp. S2-29]MEB3369519.1 hypothetical protein [Saccharopolyspora sp. S2-29]
MISTNLIDTERAALDRAAQRQTTKALAETLAEADRLGLPPLTWTISPGLSRTLAGRVPDVDPDPHATLRAWAAFGDLGMPKPHPAVGHCPHDEEVVISVAYDPEIQDPSQR